MTSKAILCTLVAAVLGAVGRPAAADPTVYELHAASTTVTMSDGTQVPMWGFGLGLEDGPVSIPGPALEVLPGTDGLEIHLRNYLPVPVSVVIPQLPAAMTPVWDDGSSGPRTNLQQRVVSFTAVAQPGQTAVYQWNNIGPGTYLYHSGTHPAVQVAMGLYGAVRHEDVAGQSYGLAYDGDALLVYSEIDPTLNSAVSGGTYGTAAYPTTINYQPRYFLINGQETASPIALQQSVSQPRLLRLVNAGLRTVVPTLSAGSMALVAEDGHAAPFVRQSYSMLLPAGTTRDALFVPTEAGDAVLFDRRSASKLARISVTTAEGAPVAQADAYPATEDTTLDTALAALPGVLDNDTGVGLTAVLDSGTSAGALALQPDGSFSYTPALDFNGTDTFSYHATDGTLSSNVVTVSIDVAPVNDAPVAIDDAYQASEGSSLAVSLPGVLANDSDADLDTLSAQLVAGPAGGTLSLAADGSFEYTPDPGTTSDSFTYRASDGTATSGTATVNITVIQPVNLSPVAADDYGTTERNTELVIDVIANDSDSDGAIDPTSVAITSQPTRGGTATSLGDGTVRYAPKRNFKGTDTFTYVVSDELGAVSSEATVHVNVIKP